MKKIYALCILLAAFLSFASAQVSNNSNASKTVIDQLPWFEDFESGVFPPTGWELEATDPDTTWTAIDYYGETWAGCLGKQSSHVEKLFTPTFDLSNYSGHIIMYFDYMSYQSYAAQGLVDFNVFFSEDGGVTYQEYPLWQLSHHAYISDMESTRAIINLSEYAGQSSLKFAFIYEGEIGPFYIDNIDIHHSTGISEESMETTLVYPNPAKDAIHVSAESEMSLVEIYNLMGQRVSSSNVTGTEATINASTLAPGNYILNIHTDNGVCHQKVVIAR
ncbi:MAG: T9SS type A sorting domain-containing protein [Bacteroidales bacterium]|nr:T9SS type A sorting domain-containing protein [Bacteroidales bacterium]